MPTERPFGIVDADGHITDPIAHVREYIAGPYASWNYRLGGVDGFDTAMGGRLGARALEAEAWLDALEVGGMERAVLYPTAGLAFGLIGDKDAAVAICQAYNTYFNAEWHAKTDLLHGIATIPLQDIDEAIVELRRAKQMGFVGAMLPAIARGALLGDERYFPLYEEAQRIGMTLNVHAATHGLDQVGSDVYDKFIGVHTYTFPAAMMRQFTSVVYAGVSELFPDLRIGWMESGCSWLPFWLDRMDSEWKKRGEREAPRLTIFPSDAVRKAPWYFHAEAEETLIPQALEYLGAEKLFYASDWPHWDNEYPESLDELLEREDVTAHDKRLLLRENALRMYGMGE
jgi:predicted TIM-barrel fold metal-dependent hydrolase